MSPLTNDALIGSICAVKNLYNHSTSSGPGTARWSEIQDPILEERRLKELGQSHVIVRRFSRHLPENGNDGWTTHSIEVKGPRLKATFDKIFNGYPNWYPDSNPYTFFPPFKPLVHRWDEVIREYESEKNEEAKMELHIFRKEVEPLLTTHISALKEAILTGVLSFETLRLVLAPGGLMISNGQANICLSKLAAAKLVHPSDDDYDHAPANRKKPYWSLALGEFDWNGSTSGFSITRTKIHKFDEPKLITRLDVYPFAFTPDRQRVRETLLARGRKFESLRGFHVRTCRGKKLVDRSEPYAAPMWVAEPVRQFRGIPTEPCINFNLYIRLMVASL